ncbi:MAG: DNA mismatch repair protein MutS [Chitinivibrionales bacterium]|nr:DNA mismatch repair protein MutS [Chitinivibrionales bacterium]
MSQNLPPQEAVPFKGSTPMMRQYLDIKQKNPETVILYRMGDFYEMFNDDAKIASRVLGLTLTARNHGGSDKTPLAGFPHHALDRYANKLVHAGYKIAICEQVEDPKTAKGIVKRDIIEIITAGTAVEDAFIDAKTNNYIICLLRVGDVVGLSLCDISCGQFYCEDISVGQVLEELVRLNPAELLFPDGDEEKKQWYRSFKQHLPALLLSAYDGWKFHEHQARSALCSHFSVVSLQGLGFDAVTPGLLCAGGLLSYLKEQKKNELPHIVSLKKRNISEFAELDSATIRNLELLTPLHSADSGATLLWVLDNCSTAGGSRLLKRWLTHPLRDITAVQNRLDCVEWLKNDAFIRGEIDLFLKNVADIERLIGRISVERANGRDVVSLKNSIAVFPSIIQALSAAHHPLFRAACEALSGFEQLATTIGTMLVDSPPLSVRDGGMIREGVSAELDEIKGAAFHGKQWIARLQQTERDRSGIATLKVHYNKVFGYYIEVSKTHLDSVPDNYIRKQTLTNAERFVTQELKDMEDKILGSHERSVSMEYELFAGLRKMIGQQCSRIQQAADAIAVLDVFISLAKIASLNRYCRPQLNESYDMIITEGRHPVVEKLHPEQQFVPNDLQMEIETAQILMITGPNMAGKSTYLRQNALIAIMAQMGSFVPATSAQIGIVDKFFTRVGASDRLAYGQSTFLVEMIEVANILNNASVKSLVLLDEVGRGTSTFDGISIAWAVAEFLHESEICRPRTLFATHYHELTELSLLFNRIKNFHIAVKEWNDTIVFLRKIEPGSCDHSYGIQVARLAGVPAVVVLRAKEILTNLENMELTPDHRPVIAHRKKEKKRKGAAEKVDGFQMNFFDTLKTDIISRLCSLDVDSMTPLEALNELSRLKKEAATVD